MNTDQRIASVSVDLKRIALAYHDDSMVTGKRFIEEVLKVKKEINLDDVAPYMKRVLEQLDSILANKDVKMLAEDALMYSTVLQNYYISKLNNT